MHIEPGIVTGAKLALSYATAAGVALYGAKLAWQDLKDGAAARLVTGAAASTALTFAFFQILPHFPVGVSEVHFILGSTMFLIFGAVPAAIGLALGLLTQGLFFAPTDLPQYFMNVTTLLVPLFAMSALARRVIPKDTAYVDLSYAQVAKMSVAFQGGVVAWVGFWAFYGQGFSAESLAAVSSFGAAYMMVVLIEPLADLAVLALAKAFRDGAASAIFTPRLTRAA
ncbi:MAG: energy-coupling factor ABC transporter permease [Brevirhabdus sp.]